MSNNSKTKTIRLVTEICGAELKKIEYRVTNTRLKMDDLENKSKTESLTPEEQVKLQQHLMQYYAQNSVAVFIQAFVPILIEEINK